jgi:hypothetical protein
MPEYSFKHKETGEVVTLVLSLAEREEFLKDENWKQVLSTPNIVGQVGSLYAKTDDGWKDTLKSIKKASGRGNTINT